MNSGLKWSPVWKWDLIFLAAYLGSSLFLSLFREMNEGNGYLAALVCGSGLLLVAATLVGIAAGSGDSLFKQLIKSVLVPLLFLGIALLVLCAYPDILACYRDEAGWLIVTESSGAPLAILYMYVMAGRFISGAAIGFVFLRCLSRRFTGGSQSKK